MQEVRAAVIGTGVMGRKYAQMIAEGRAGALRLTAVVCRSAGAQQWAKDTLPDTVRVCPSADQLYDYAEEFDAVLVVTPHKTHPALVMQAFAHGKHVLCDKPSANALAPALEMNRAAEKSGLVFAMMFHQRRYKKYMRLKKLLDDGVLGEIKRVQLENSRYFRTWMYHRSGSWRSSWAGEGGGVLLNQCPHQLDLWQWICGMPVSVTAHCNVGKFHDIEVEDEAVLYTEFANGATGVFITTTGDLPGTNRLEIVGTLGKIVIEGGTLKHWKLSKSEREICATAPESCPRVESEYTEYTPGNGRAHAGILQNYANALLHGEELIAPGYDGLMQITLINAAYLSAWSGSTKVTLPFDKALYDKLLAEKIAHSSFRSEVKPLAEDKEQSNRWQVNW